jgi:hypothetical protein
MTAGRKIRTFACILLVLALCAPMLALAGPAARTDSAAEFRALAPASSTLCLARAGVRQDQARQRSSAPSVFTLISLRAGVSDPGRLAARVQCLLPNSLRSGGPRAGRSPPAIS